MRGLLRPALKEEYVSPRWKSWRQRQDTPDVWSGEAPNAPVDIIAVQGLAATYERTWTKRHDDGSSVMWLRDLLPQDMPLARILTFEYDSKWLEDPAFVTLRDCAARLLQSIIWDRTHRGETQMCRKMARRPIILLGHSYGGLVIKQALIRAATAFPSDASYDDYLAIATSVAGVIFLGTPHAGSTFAKYGGIMAKFRSPFGSLPNTDILRPLALGDTSELLPGLHEDFQRVRDIDHLCDLRTYYFWETKGSKIGLVVDRTSACYGAQFGSCFPLEATHREMNKYGSRDESNYRLVRDCLMNISQEAQKIIDKRWEKYHYGSPHAGSEVKNIQDWLSPVEIVSRHDRLQSDRLQHTCKWALEVQEIFDWLDPNLVSQNTVSPKQQRPVWIRGKSGSGKSVLSAFLYDRAIDLIQTRLSSTSASIQCAGNSESRSCEVRLQSDRMAALYFPLQDHQPTILVIKSLIHQLLQAQPLNTELRRITAKFKEQHNVLSLSSSIELLTRILPVFSLIYLIVDALDESIEPAELIRSLQPFSSLQPVRLLLLSRQDELLQNEIHDHFTLHPTTFDITSFNQDDIVRFIERGVSRLSCTSPKIFTSQLQKQIQEKLERQAQGMFQWVNLVIDALSQHGKTKDDVLRVLEHFPPKLDLAYTRTFERLRELPEFKWRRAKLALKWLTCAVRPLKCEELKIAIELEEKLSSSSSYINDNITDIVAALANDELQPIKDFFSFLGPLVDIRQLPIGVNSIQERDGSLADSQVIEICHHSLKQWIHQQIFNAESSSQCQRWFSFTNKAAHAQVAVTCLRVLSSREQLLQFLQCIYRVDSTPNPFLNYAGEYWSYHLRAAGIWEERDIDEPASSDLLALMHAVLSVEVQMSITVLGALSSALNDIKPGEVRQLSQVVAVRDLQNNLLLAAESVADLNNALPDISMELQEVIEVLAGKGRMKYSDWQAGTLKELESLSRIKQSLNEELDSPAMIEMMRKAQPDLEAFQKLKQRLLLFRKAARALRRITIFVAVDPIRTWLYEQVGKDGVSPIAALAHSVEAMDSYLAYALLSSNNFPHYNFRDQFSASPDHPLYGPIVSARHELVVRKAAYLGAAFYKEHILDHFKLRRWEWKLIQAMLIILESQPNLSVQLDRDTLLQKWLVGPLKSENLVRHSHVSRPASRLFADTTPRAFSQITRAGEKLLASVKFIVLLILKFFAFVVPSLERLFLKFALMTGSRYRLAMPLMRGLIQDWNYASFSIVMYALRVHYMPWLFSPVRYTPWTDLNGVIRDPFGYDLVIFKRSKHVILLLVTQEIVLGLVAFIDVVRITDPEIAPYFVPITLRRILARQYPSPGIESLRLLIKQSLPYLLKLCLNLLRMIFLERTLFLSIYMLFDLIKVSAYITRSSTYGNGATILFTSGIFINFVATQYGTIGTIIVAAVIMAIDFMWKTLHLGLLVRWLLDPVVAHVPFFYRQSMNVLSDIAALLKISDIRDAAVSAIFLAKPSTVIFGSAWFLILLCTFFAYNMIDPLHMRYARQSSTKAAEMMKRMTEDDKPMAYLQWQATESKHLERWPQVELEVRESRVI